MVVYSPLFPPYRGMSDSPVFNWIAEVLVRFLCDHDDPAWTMDRHYNDKKCLRGTCRCCFARDVLNLPLPQNEDACEMCSTAWRLSTVSRILHIRILKKIAIAHGQALPRYWSGWPGSSLPPWWHCHGTSPVADGGYKPQAVGQPEIEPYSAFGAAPPTELVYWWPVWPHGKPKTHVRLVYRLIDEEEGYEPQWKWGQERWARWAERGRSSSSQHWPAAEIEADDTFGAAPPVADEKTEHWGYKPQWNWYKPQDEWERERWAGWIRHSCSSYVDSRYGEQQSSWGSQTSFTTESRT